MRVFLARRRVEDGTSYHSRYADKRKVYAKSRRARKRAAFVEHIDPAVVFERDGWRCQLCGDDVSRDVDPRHPKAPSVDHIVPLARGGLHEYTNVQCAHYGCNSSKRDRDQAAQLALFG